MKKIGFFISNFNPINLTHINFLNEIKKEFSLDEIYLKISNDGQNTLPIIPHAIKKKMCLLAIKNLDCFKLYDDVYSTKDYDFATIFNRIKNKDNSLFFIVSPFFISNLPKIYDINKITKFAKIISLISPKKYNLLSKKFSIYGDNVILKEKNLQLINSKKLRIMLSLDKDCSSYLDPLVLKYIKQNNLYSKKEFLYLECLQSCKKHTSQKRFAHCTFVAKAAKELAKTYGENELDAQIAGLLHDIMKEKNKEYMLNLFKTFKTNLEDSQKLNPKIWHGLAGAIYVKQILGLDDEKIINSIKYHTVPKKNMSTFEKIIFIADRISQDRTYKNVNFLRSLAITNLDSALIYSLSNTIISLIKKKSTISTPTIECYNNLILKNRSKNKQ